MAKSYHIKVADLETVAYIYALLTATGPVAGSRFENTTRENVEENFPGGVRAAKNACTLGMSGGRRRVWKQLDKILDDEYITHTSAPWLKPIAPTEIDGHPVTCSKAGIAVGCANVSLDELKLLVEECEACDE